MSTPVCLEWQNLSLTIKTKEFQYLKCRSQVEEKKILRNVSGNLKSGQLVAILGASGAGKTTLLASISQRLRGPLKGRISLNGDVIDRESMIKVSCFVPQFDIAFDTLTPNEHMHFMSELKLDRKWTKAQKMERIDFLLREVGLKAVANNRILTMSGGERKRLTLATDLLTNPPIIFLDEPTTGLDSFSAYSVINTLKYLTETDNSTDETTNTNDGILVDPEDIELLPQKQCAQIAPKAVLCSIHQPTSEIFASFSHIILMCAGRCVFQGTTEQALIHFSSLGLRCPPAYNPADFFINSLSRQNNELEGDQKSFFKRPSELLQQPIEYKALDNNSYGVLNISDYEMFRKPWWIKQVYLLTQRSMMHSKRSFWAIFVDLLAYLIPFLAMALIYPDASAPKTQRSVQDMQGVFVLLSCELIFTMSYGIINHYPMQMPILRRETNDHMYSFSAYYVAEVLCITPLAFLRSFVGVAVFWIGYRGDFLSYLTISITLMLSSYTANAYGLMVSGIFETVMTDLTAITDIIFLSLSGFYINLNAFPYLRYISLFFYSNEALSILYWYNVTDIVCPAHFDGNCQRNGTEVLLDKSYNTQLIDVLWDYLGLIVLAVIMHLLAFTGIRRLIRSIGYY